MSFYGVQPEPTKTDRQVINKGPLKMSVAIEEGSALTFWYGHHQMGLFLNSSETMFPILIPIRWSLRYSNKETGSPPLRSIMSRSLVIPYCQIVSYTFSKSRNRISVSCFVDSSDGRWCCGFPETTLHWPVSSILDFARYQMKRVLIMLPGPRIGKRSLRLVCMVSVVFVWVMGITVNALHWGGKSASRCCLGSLWWFSLRP